MTTHSGVRSDSLQRSAYQLVPLTKLVHNGLRALLICDGVGVGKTISAGYILTQLTRNHGAGLVVCPPFLIEKWRLEMRDKFGFVVVPLRTAEEISAVMDTWSSPTDLPTIFLIPSSLLSRQTIPPFTGPVVIDEIHNYRNPETRLWQCAQVLLRNSTHRIGLSATPINNGLSDLAAELALLLKLDRFSAGALVQDAWRPEKRRILYPILTRFSKERLGIHFARRRVHDIGVNFPSTYMGEVRNAVKALRARPLSHSIYRDEITYYRLASSSPRAFERSIGVTVSHPRQKLNEFTKILDNHAAEHVLVFCEFEETARELSDSSGERQAFCVTGQVPVFERENIVRAFRDSTNGVLVMTAVGSEGLDLQFCSTLINYDLNWNPMVLEQRIGRIDRIGQQKDIITVHNFLVNGSIDERILHTLGKKLGVVTGSLLEPSTILGEHSPTVTPLYDEATIEHETNTAAHLSDSIKLSADIIPDDYDVLDSIDIAYCDPVAIRANRHKTPWLLPQESGTAWAANLSRDSRELLTLVHYYS